MGGGGRDAQSIVLHIRFPISMVSYLQGQGLECNQIYGRSLYLYTISSVLLGQLGPVPVILLEPVQVDQEYRAQLGRGDRIPTAPLPPQASQDVQHIYSGRASNIIMYEQAPTSTMQASKKKRYMFVFLTREGVGQCVQALFNPSLPSWPPPQFSTLWCTDSQCS